jgi:2-haloacid dehalogenase
MRRILVFDVSETLLDLCALEPGFRRAFGDPSALREWFGLLLLYSEASTLAGIYPDFAALAGATLDMTAFSRGRALASEDKERILSGMLSLPAHPEVPAALQMLRDSGFRLVALTNSSQPMVNAQLAHAGLSRFFERVYSVDRVRRYKPAPEPYRMVAEDLGAAPERLRMVAAHPWDILGAIQAGCAAAFVARPGKVLFPLVRPPDIVGENLKSVAEVILKRESALDESTRGQSLRQGE